MKENPSCEELETRVQELEKKLNDARSLTEEIMMYMTEGLVMTDTRGRSCSSISGCRNAGISV